MGDVTGSRPRVIAIVGSASRSLSRQQQSLAEQAGRAVVDAGCVLVTGGMSGVMEAASRGARNSAACGATSVVGILPSYDRSQANEYVQLAIATGLQLGRNALVVASADAVVAIGGGSGTLSEIAFAWQMNKPIVAIRGVAGWADELAGRCLDERGKTAIAEATDGRQAVHMALELASQVVRDPGAIDSGWRGESR